MSINQNHPHIAAHIAEAMQHLGDMPESMPGIIEQAAAHISQQLVAGHKLLVQATAGVAPLGDLFCYNLLQRYPDQRPALPAIALDRIEIAAAPAAGSDFKAFFRATEAIANKGDVLLVLADQRLPGIEHALEQLYIGRGVGSVLMAPAGAGNNSPANPHTKHIPLEYDTIAGIHEMSLFILNTLGDMIDSTVFGGVQFND